MRTRRNDRDEMAAIARRRLELLSAELADLRSEVAERAAADPTVADRTPAEPRPGGAPAPEVGSATAGEAAPPGRHARRPVARPARLGGWVHDRLPPTLQGRVRLTTGHLAVVALLVAAGLAATSWWLLRADGTTSVVPASTWTDARAPVPEAAGSPAALVTPAAEATPAHATEPAVVVVDVAGRVRRPGIAALPVGSRVVDALEAAGGVRRGVDLTTLNLARVLVDGEQVVVGMPPPGGVAAPAASGAATGSVAEAGPLVALNVAGQAELEELPGVGPVIAQAILQWRADHGPFTAVDELLEVSGIGEATLAKIAPHVTL